MYTAKLGFGVAQGGGQGIRIAQAFLESGRPYALVHGQLCVKPSECFGIRHKEESKQRGKKQKGELLPQ
jgi:hypothetical protein